MCSILFNGFLAALMAISAFISSYNQNYPLAVSFATACLLNSFDFAWAIKKYKKKEKE
jgi:hypothetical protein